jgi:hypothetical protein
MAVFSTKGYVVATTGSVVELIVRELTLSFCRSSSRDSFDGAVLLAFDPDKATERETSEAIVKCMIVTREAFDLASRDLQERAVDDQGVAVLRRFSFNRPWFDIAVDADKDRILLRVHKIHGLRLDKV